MWGSDTNRVKDVEKGDKAAIYIMETTKKESVYPPRIKGLYEVTSNPYISRKRIFKGGTYPNRVKLKPEIVLEEGFVNFKELIPDLDFITNKKYWFGHFRAGINDISKKDYQLIKKKTNALKK